MTRDGFPSFVGRGAFSLGAEKGAPIGPCEKGRVVMGRYVQSQLSDGWLRALNAFECRRLVGSRLGLRVRNLYAGRHFGAALARAMRGGAENVCVCKVFPETDECHWVSLARRGRELHLYDTSTEGRYDCSDVVCAVSRVCGLLCLHLVVRKEFRGLQGRTPYCQTWSMVALLHHQRPDRRPLDHRLFWRTCARIRRVRGFGAWGGGVSGAWSS